MALPLLYIMYVQSIIVNRLRLLISPLSFLHCFPNQNFKQHVKQLKNYLYLQN